MTIHSEDLREKVARIVRYVEMRREKPLRQMDDTIHGIHMGTEWEAELRLSDLETVLSLLSSIKEGGGEVLSAVGSGLTPLVPSRVPEPGPATPSLVGQSDIHYITAALSWYDGGPAGADVQSAWRRIRDACGYTGAPDEGPHHAPDTREGSNGREATGGRPDSKPSHKDSQ